MRKFGAGSDAYMDFLAARGLGQAHADDYARRAAGPAGSPYGREHVWVATEPCPLPDATYFDNCPNPPGALKCSWRSPHSKSSLSERQPYVRAQGA